MKNASGRIKFSFLNSVKKWTSVVNIPANNKNIHSYLWLRIAYTLYSLRLGKIPFYFLKSWFERLWVFITAVWCSVVSLYFVTSWLLNTFQRFPSSFYLFFSKKSKFQYYYIIYCHGNVEEWLIWPIHEKIYTQLWYNLLVNH